MYLCHHHGNQDVNNTTYKLEDHVLGVNITTDLKWSRYIRNITKKSGSLVSSKVKTQTYMAMVRPIIEYASVISFA